MCPYRNTETIIVDRSDADDRWRYCCPRTHSAIKPSGDGIWCRTCERDGKQARYERLLDKFRETLLPVEDVEFASN